MELDLDKLSPQEQKEAAVNICREWFDIDKMAKSFYTDEMLEMKKLYNGDHWNLKGPGGTELRTEKQQQVRPNPVENYTFAHIEGLVSEFSQEMELVDFPVEKSDEMTANTMTKLKKFLGYKNKLDSELPKFLRNFFLYGTGIFTAYWDPLWRGGRGPNRWIGDIRWESLHPKSFFPDARCSSDINDGRRVHKALYKTFEHIKSMYPGAKISADSLDAELTLDEDPQTSLEDDSVLIVETWYKGQPMILDEGEKNQGDGMHVIWWAGESNPVYLKHANYIYFEPDEDPKFPFIVKQCYPRENSIWGYGEAYFLKNPQIILNKTSEIILEGHIHQALGQTVYNEGALTPKQREMVKNYGNLAGMWYPVRDVGGIKKLFPTGIPATLQNEVVRLQRTMEAIIGRFDITQGKTPGSVTAFRALSLLAARAQVRLRSKEMAIMTAFEEVGKYINHLIDRFYTERRIFRIIGENNEKTEYGEYRADDFKKVYLYETGDIMPYNQFNPSEYVSEERPEGLIEGEDYEVYSPEFDVICKVTTVPAYDKIFFMDMAKELFVAQIIDEKTFWYVMEHGKFPPYEKMRLEALENAMQTPQGQELPQEGGEVQEGGQIIDPIQQLQAILEQRPDLRQQLESLPPEQRNQVISNLLQPYGVA